MKSITAIILSLGSLVLASQYPPGQRTCTTNYITSTSLCTIPWTTSTVSTNYIPYTTNSPTVTTTTCTETSTATTTVTSSYPVVVTTWATTVVTSEYAAVYTTVSTLSSDVPVVSTRVTSVTLPVVTSTVSLTSTVKKQTVCRTIDRYGHGDGPWLTIIAT